MYPPPIQKVIDLFSKFPTIGPRTASRFVFYLIKMPQEGFNDLINSLKTLKESIKICGFCFNPFSPSLPEENICPICKDLGREKNLLCLVEKETDLISIEKTKKYKGLYFIIGEAASVLKKDFEEKIRIKELEERIKEPEKFGIVGTGFKEIIIAINPTPEGETTTLFLDRKLKSLAMPDGKLLPKISRLARGLPAGGELEYADQETLGSAFEGRK